MCVQVDLFLSNLLVEAAPKHPLPGLVAKHRKVLSSIAVDSRHTMTINDQDVWYTYEYEYEYQASISMCILMCAVHNTSFIFIASGVHQYPSSNKHVE